MTEIDSHVWDAECNINGGQHGMESRLDTVPPGTVHLDTVRALHQTVVSLRTALELSKNELKELKQKYQQHSNCIEYADVIEKLTLENHILRRKIIDSDYVEKDSNTQNIKLEVTYSPRLNNDDYNSNEVVIKTATTEGSSRFEADPDSVNTDNKLSNTENKEHFCSTDNLNDIQEEKSESELNESAEFSQDENTSSTPTENQDPNSQVASFTKYSEQPSFKTKLELLSKFDVRIKVRTLKEGTIFSSTTSDSDSTVDKKEFNFDEKREHFENTENSKGDTINLKSVASENIKMAVPNEADAKSKVDKFDVQVRITSEENLVVKENVERTRKKETLNLDVDDLSLR